MRRILLFALVAVAAFLLLSSGCLQKAKKLGCCVKKNATNDEKCMLFNMSTDKFIDLYSETAWCNKTSGYCNVSILGNYTLIPICSGDTLTSCIKPDCTTMVCGDFTYKPRIAPGIASTEDISESVPPESDEEETIEGLYNAQCRFFSMDSKLRLIMKNSNSVINRFRFGVGSDFDEFDLYRNYFPMSDKFCSLNPMGKIDRYMNYIDSSFNEYNPYEKINDNCINDSQIPAPFTFGDSKYPTDILPEKSSYKFADYYKEVKVAKGMNSFKSSTIGQTYKKLDENFYRKTLSSIYVDNFYSKNVVRAPFECSSQLSDCMSGACKTDYYSRGVMLVANQSGAEIEVPTDCHYATDDSGKRGVVCFPTLDYTKSATKGNPPTFTYARVPVRTWGFRVDQDNYDSEDIKETKDGVGCKGDDHRCELEAEWGFFNGVIASYRDESFGSYKSIRMIPKDWTAKNMTAESAYPPAAQIWFHGRDDIKWSEGGETHNIIGMAIIDRDDFKDTYFAKYCGLFEAGEAPYMPPEFGNETDCKSDCPLKCGSSAGMVSKCNDYCYQHVTLKNASYPAPCNVSITTSAYQSPYLIEVDLSNMTNKPDDKFYKLAKAFKPYFNARMDGIGNMDWANDGCGVRADDIDLVLSSYPWVIGYKKFKGTGTTSGNLMVKGSGAPAIVEYLDRNFYNRDTSNFVGIDGCAVRKYTNNHDDDDEFSYHALLPQYVYLIKSRKVGEEYYIGKCKLLPKTQLPKLNTYGWCEPCTLSTIAYQKVTTQPNPYLPVLEKNNETKKSTSICSYSDKKTSCYAPHITDIGDYDNIDLTTLGAPRTEPEASLMKERLGDYLKSSIMPVLDLSDASNWNIDSTYETGYKSVFEDTVLQPLGGIFPVKIETYGFREYDFQRLLSNAGSIVVVVDSVGSDPNTTRILKKTQLIRSHCWRCLTAVHVAPPSWSLSDYNDTLKKLFADPRIRLNLDLVTFDYTVAQSYGQTDDRNKSIAAVNDMASFGRASLAGYGKPSIITEFWVAENSEWGDDNYDTLFSTIIEEEDELVKGGILGVIYSPVRSKYAAGIVKEAVNGVGTKKPKFCALERATGLLGSTRPYAQFSRTTVLSSMNCTKCTTLEISLGTCNTTCMNGVECSLPTGALKSQYKCPDNTVVAPCSLCNATSGLFLCNKTYTNGTIFSFNISSQYINADSYGDIIGGLKKNKCCLQTEQGVNYSYVKKTLTNVVSAPIVFPKTGDPSVDCGMATSQTLAEAGGFCGAKVPIQNYDMECAFEEVPASQLNAVLPQYNAITPEDLIPFVSPP